MAHALRLHALSALLILAWSAQAEAPLSDAEVRGFIASLADVSAAGLDLDSGDFASPASAAVRRLRGAELSEFETGLRGRGFADAAHWARVGDRVYRAYFALTLAREAGRAEAELRRAPSEAANALDKLRRAIQSSPGDAAVVAAHREMIERAWTFN